MAFPYEIEKLTPARQLEIRKILVDISDWSDDERATLMTELRIILCQHCGKLTTKMCYCENDE